MIQAISKTSIELAKYFVKSFFSLLMNNKTYSETYDLVNSIFKDNNYISEKENEKLMHKNINDYFIKIKILESISKHAENDKIFKNFIKKQHKFENYILSPSSLSSCFPLIEVRKNYYYLMNFLHENGFKGIDVEISSHLKQLYTLKSILSSYTINNDNKQLLELLEYYNVIKNKEGVFLKSIKLENLLVLNESYFQSLLETLKSQSYKINLDCETNELKNKIEDLDTFKNILIKKRIMLIVSYIIMKPL